MDNIVVIVLGIGVMLTLALIAYQSLHLDRIEKKLDEINGKLFILEPRK